MKFEKYTYEFIKNILLGTFVETSLKMHLNYVLHIKFIQRTKNYYILYLQLVGSKDF